MKTQSFQLKIEKPCHEDWDAMTVVEQGKFCSHCTKVVVDFSNMSNEGIAQYFKTHTGKTCGNFRKTQLKQIYSFTYKTPFSFNTTFVRLSLAGVLIFSGLKGYSQGNCGKDNSGKTNLSTISTVKGHVKRPVTDEASASRKSSLYVKLKDNSTGKQLGTGTITIKETQQKLKMNMAGIYTCKLPDSLANKIICLRVETPGYISETIEINVQTQGSKILNIGLDNYNSMKKGEVMYVPEEKKVNTN